MAFPHFLLILLLLMKIKPFTVIFKDVLAAFNPSKSGRFEGGFSGGPIWPLFHIS